MHKHTTHLYTPVKEINKVRQSKREKDEEEAAEEEKHEGKIIKKQKRMCSL